MAAINGISVRGLKSFLDHEGVTIYQGTLCLNGKKIGFWTQDAWGGMDHFDFELQYSKELLDQLVRKMNPDKLYRGVVEYSLEILLCDYIPLWHDEKEYKKAVRAGYDGILVATDGYHVSTWRLPEKYTKMSNELLLKKMAASIEKARENFFKEIGDHKHTFKIYRNLSDFVIGEPIELEDIMLEK